jgi:hypothetical protein
MMTRIKPVLLVVALLGLSANAMAVLLQYTSEAAFISALKGPYYFEGFSGLTPESRDPFLDFGPVNGYSYTASAAGDLWITDPTGPTGSTALSTYLPAHTIEIDFTGLAVTAIGGYFYPIDIGEHLSTGAIDLTFSDGSTVSLANANQNTFVGFTSSVALTSLRIDATNGSCTDSADGNCYATVDNLYVGTPEPATLALIGLGAVGIAVRRRRSGARRPS